MKEIPCQRFWEGAVGITLTPRQQKSGEYFWTFSLVRAYKRQGSEKWEYAQHYGQKHAEALGQVMSKAFQFMEQNEPSQFADDWEAAKAVNPTEMLDGMKMPPADTTASH